MDSTTSCNMDACEQTNENSGKNDGLNLVIDTTYPPADEEQNNQQLEDNDINLYEEESSQFKLMMKLWTALFLLLPLGYQTKTTIPCLMKDTLHHPNGMIQKVQEQVTCPQQWMEDAK
jgi:hypothetical protein